MSENGRMLELRPGNRIRLGDRRRVVTVVHASEDLNGVRTSWQWVFLDDDSLLEIAPRGVFRYRRHEVLERRDRRFQELLAADGALLRFEARVRAGRAEVEPTILTLDGVEYRVRATGTAEVRRVGPPPSLGAWDATSGDHGQNVFFILEAIDGDGVTLGLWTDRLCLSFGEAVAEEIRRTDRPARRRATPPSNGAAPPTQD